MIKRIYALMLISLFAAGCSKSEFKYDNKDSNTAVSFTTEELTADWEAKSSTRGVEVKDINTLSSIMVYSFIESNSDITVPFINHKEATKDENVWSFKPAYFYPYNETLGFLAYTPKARDITDVDNNGITQELDFNNKAIKISYETPIDGRNHPDLMLATPKEGCNINNQVGKLSFNHALTKITMSAKMADGTLEEHKDRYKISIFTFYNIKTSGSLNYSTASTPIGKWKDGEYGNFIVQQILPEGNTTEYPNEEATLLTTGDEYADVMNNGQALFMIPQPIEESTNVNGKPSIQITIADTKPTVVTDGDKTSNIYLTYVTDRIALPSFDGKGWKMGQSVDLQFEFTFDENMVVIPMSLIARLMPWVEQDVDKEVDPNIHAWLDTKTVKANFPTVLKLYTNGVVKTISEATIGEKNGDYYPVYVNVPAAGQYSFEVEIENSHNRIIIKKFYINAK